MPLCGGSQIIWSCSNIILHGSPTSLYLLTQAGIFLAFTWPGFFLSTILGSRVTQPAIRKDERLA